MIVNTTDPTISFQGVLWGSRGPWLTFRDVILIVENKPPTKMDGETVLHRDKVAFMQVP